jgi:SET domain-containing protein
LKHLTTDFDNIDAPEADYLYISISQLPNAGSGLFTATPIYKEEIIAKFKGERLTSHQAYKRAVAGNDHYFINMVDGGILDSMHVACFAKYANDAKGYVDSTFKNNAKITLDDEENICLVALRNIHEGEELFCSYGKKYWLKHRLA